MVNSTRVGISGRIEEIRSQFNALALETLANLRTRPYEGRKAFLGQVLAMISRETRLHGASIFAADFHAEILECVATTGLFDSVGNAVLENRNEVRYSRGGSLTWRSFESAEKLEFKGSTDEASPWKTFRESARDANGDPVMILWPIIKGGSDETKSRAVGVVRCVLPAPNSRDAKLRLDDDKAVIEMIATQMAPVMDAFNSRIETDRLLAVTRHDLLAPLVMIEHAVDTLAEMVNAPEHSETTSRIRKDAEVAFLMVRNLVPNLTILSPPEEKFAPKVSSIAEVLAGLNRPLTHYAKENSNIILQFDDFSDCPAMMLDQALISLALFHLITNAIKYGDPGSTVYVSKAIDENSFLIHVTNYGLGIEEQEVPYLFRANYRGTRAIRAKTGQGLGLNSAKRALSLHGGDIRLTKLNNPTVFSVLLPKALAHSAQSK